jgi:signal recognition particle subunit SRP54
MALFEGLSEKLQNTIAKMRGKARVTEKDVKEMTREVKLALLEADVNFRVVKDFIKKVTEKALGQNVMESLTPGQQIVKVVHEELISMIGDKNSKITFSSQPPTIYLMAGLQGSGKTTTSGKLANLLRKEGKRPLLVACDVYRPAAIKQLQIVGKQLDISVYAEENNKNPVKIAKKRNKACKVKRL